VVIFDSNILSSARRHAGYNTSRTPRHKQADDSGIELSRDLAKSGKAFSRAKIGVSHPTEIDSQERILRREESQEGLQSRVKRKEDVHAKITRTDEVMVSYSRD
jgi:hypothetical protein